MIPDFFTPKGTALPVYFIKEAEFKALVFSAFEQNQVKLADFKASPSQIFLLLREDGALKSVFFGKDPHDPFAAGKLADLLPEGLYEFKGEVDDYALSALAFAGQQYRFSRYKKETKNPRILKVPSALLDRLIIETRGIFLARDLINTPANDMHPATLEEAVFEVAEPFKAEVSVIRGEDLLAQNFPLIYHVGKASVIAPRLIDLTWGKPDAPRVTIVGKGVCFDTGGLNIKPDHGMLLMKKDMGGAATALALAQMIMALGLNLRLRLLIPAVENSIAGNAFRPSDIYPSRKGLSVEIGNTDAEGRLVLADALTLADEESPEIIIDFATLTGAARVALGPDLPPFYCHDDILSQDLSKISTKVHDPMWRMPLWHAYDRSMDGKISDLSSTGSLPFAGSITAAHFLNRFVSNCKSYLHFDIYAHVPVAKAGRPYGGELQAARACLSLLEERYGVSQ